MKKQLDGTFGKRREKNKISNTFITINSNSCLSIKNHDPTLKHTKCVKIHTNGYPMTYKSIGRKKQVNDIAEIIDIRQ